MLDVLISTIKSSTNKLQKKNIWCINRNISMLVLPEFNCCTINSACKYACFATDEVPATIVEQAIQSQALQNKANKLFATIY